METKIRVVTVQDGVIVKKLQFDKNGNLIGKFGLSVLSKEDWVRIKEGMAYPVRKDAGGYEDSDESA